MKADYPTHTLIGNTTMATPWQASCAERKFQSMLHVVLKEAHCRDLLSWSDCHNSVLLLLCHKSDWCTDSFP